DWSSLKAQRPTWVRDGTARVIVQMGLRDEPELCALKVPSVWSYIASPEDKAAVELLLAQQIFGRPYVAARATPPAAVRILRTWFMDVVDEQAFLADAEESRNDISRTSGEDGQKRGARVFSAKPDVGERANNSTQE